MPSPQLSTPRPPGRPPHPGRWAPLTQAAAHRGTSTKTIQRWIEKGYLPAWRPSPQRVWVDLDILDRTPDPKPGRPW
jgi:hypothetical protein